MAPYNIFRVMKRPLMLAVCCSAEILHGYHRGTASLLAQFRRELLSSDSCALQGPSCFHFNSWGLLSICFTDGLHMHDKSNVFGVNCAHAAAICPGLLGVRQPGSALAPAGLLAIWKLLMHSQALFPPSFLFFLTLYSFSVRPLSVNSVPRNFWRASSPVPEHKHTMILEVRQGERSSSVHCFLHSTAV